jgi:hypothetical protein
VTDCIIAGVGEVALSVTWPCVTRDCRLAADYSANLARLHIEGSVHLCNFQLRTYSKISKSVCNVMDSSSSKPINSPEVVKFAFKNLLVFAIKTFICGSEKYFLKILFCNCTVQLSQYNYYGLFLLSYRKLPVLVSVSLTLVLVLVSTKLVLVLVLL